MPDINLHLDDWQQEALSELARSRGLTDEKMANTLLSERLIERIHCAFDDLLSGEPILAPEAIRMQSGRREGLTSADTIEQRLKRLFTD
ncbi:MAG: hypothetical protein HY248_07060 [Fimbriimonas ginsengisoli]|nr:hypothetical protein [Fimbriimonas ginsengisoli]